MSLRLGIVGSGAMAEYHAKRFSGLPGVALAAVCDHLPSKAEAFARSFGIPSRFTDPGAMIESGEVEALAVASLDSAHAGAAIRALDRGIAVFCEKPMARRLSEAEAMAEAARRANARGTRSRGTPAIVNFSKRNGGLLAAAASALAEGGLGPLLGIELEYLQSWLLQDAWGDWRTTPRWRWRLVEEQSTYGALGDLGSHLLDAALVLAAGDPRTRPTDKLEAEACAARRFVPDDGFALEGKPAFESFEARLALGGIAVSLKAGWRFPGRLDEFTAVLRCEKGRIEVAPGRSRSSLRVYEDDGVRELAAAASASTY